MTPIWIEVTISKKTSCILFTYRPLQNSNKTLFFEERADSLGKMTNKYDNVYLMGDLNIDLLVKSKDINKQLSDLCHTFLLKNLVLEKTCFKPHERTWLDIMLTNRPKTFHSPSVVDRNWS